MMVIIHRLLKLIFIDIIQPSPTNHWEDGHRRVSSPPPGFSPCQHAVAWGKNEAQVMHVFRR